MTARTNAASYADLRAELDVATRALAARDAEVERLRACVWGLEQMQPRVPDGVDLHVLTAAADAMAAVQRDGAYPYCHTSTRQTLERALGGVRIYLGAAGAPVA